MKKILFILIALFSFLGTNAQGFYIGVEGCRTFKDNEDNAYEYSNWDAGVFASYSNHLFLRVGYEVNAGLYTRYYDNEIPMDIPNGISMKVSDMYALAYGGKIGANITLKIARPISVFSGPSLSYNFFQKGYVKHDGKKDSYGIFGMHPALLQWKFGAQLDFWRIRTRLSWNFDVTKREELANRYNALELSVAYRL